jgi:cell division septation protein DedD
MQMTKKLPYVSFAIALLLFLFYPPRKTYSASNHVLISEIQIAGTTPQDEFVELYNPTPDDVVLDGFRLVKKSASADAVPANLVASISGTINAGGYFLIAHSEDAYDGPVAADEYYSAASNNIAANNTVILYSDAGFTEVDKVGMGTASDVETLAAPVPETDGSIERLPVNEDSDNNSLDFVLRDISDPQNSASESPSPQPTLSPTPSATETPSPSPSQTPIISPTPMLTPTPTSTPTPTASPSPSPSPTPTTYKIFLASFMSSSGAKSCYLQYEPTWIGFIKVLFPRIVCSLS